MNLLDKNPKLLYCYKDFKIEKNHLTFTVKPNFGHGEAYFYNIIDGLYMVYSNMSIMDGYNYEDQDFHDDMFIIHHFISGKAFFNLDNDLSAFIKEGESLFYKGDNKYISGGSYDLGIIAISLIGYKDVLIDTLKNILKLDSEISDNLNLFDYENEIFVSKTDESVISLLYKLLDSIESDNIFNIKRDSLKLFFLDAELYPRYRKTKKLLHKKSQIDMIELAIKYMHDNYESPLTIDEISYYCGLNKTTFKRIFPELYGMTPIKYLRNLRLEKGMELLENGFSVIETANMVGYQNPSKFSIAFKKKYGILPSKI